MTLSPKEIEENLEAIGLTEAQFLLREWISSAGDLFSRQEALKFLGKIDNGKNYEFFEQLFV